MEPELQSVRADRNQIEQVIMNLAVNSRDAMPAGGELRIDTKNVHLDDAYSETILLVEDAEAIRKLAAEFLTSHGFEVLSASNVEEAVNIAAAHAGAIQLLVTDVIMPGQNGRVLAERLVASYPRIKVLYISGYTDSFIAGHGVLEGDSNLLNKPFTEEALIHKVRDVLDSGKQGPRISEMLLAGGPKHRSIQQGKS